MSSSKGNEPAIDATDDLDDLDDILDEFNDSKKQGPTTGLTPSVSTSSAKAAPPSASSKNDDSIIPGAAESRTEDVAETEEEANERFAKELAVGMEALMKGLGGPSEGIDGSTAGSNQGTHDVPGSESLFNEEEMMRQFEKMMTEMGLGGMSGLDGLSGSGSSDIKSNGQAQAPPPPPANFQEAIKNTMSRLRESDATASSSTAGADGMDLEKLMAALGNGEGLEGEEGMAKMLESMMGELMSKDVLYEPLKELKDKYPGYLANPPMPLSAEDRNRYQLQYSIVSQVIAIFDDKKFDTGTEVEKAALKDRVQVLMNEMQDNGAPPSEIVGDLPPELENMPGLGNDENCVIM